MPTLREIYLFPPGQGGLNTKASPLGLSPEWLIEAKNVEYVTAGGRSKRKGQQKINPIAPVEDSPIGKVDQTSFAGTKVLYIGSTTGFGAGDYVTIAQGMSGEEYGRVESIQAGDYLKVEDNLENQHIEFNVIEQQTSSNTWIGVRQNVNQQYISQGFTHDGSGAYMLNKVECWMFKQGSPTGYIWCEIWGSDGSDKPDPTNVISGEANAVKVLVQNPPSGGSWWGFIFVSPPTLTMGVDYHIVIRGDFTINGTDYVAWSRSNTNPYRAAALPYCLEYSLNGSTWNPLTNEDARFRISRATEVKKCAAITGYLDFIKNNLQQIELVAASNGRIYTEGGGTLTERHTGLTQGTDIIWVMTVFKDNAILANHNDPALYTPDGITFTEISDPNLPTTAGLPAAWRNRLWMADGDTLYYSTLDSFTDWTSTGDEIPILHGKGPITAIIPFGKVLVVAKADSITLITGSTPDDFAVQNLPGEVGIAGPHAWAPVGNDILFVSLEDVQSLVTVIDYANIKSNTVSRDIEPTLRDEVNPNRRRFIQCAYYPAKSQFWVVFADRNSVIEDRALVLDAPLQGWSMADPLLGHTLATKRSTLGHRLLVSGGNDGFLRLLDTGETDDGKSITALFKTPHFDLGHPNQVKGWRKLILFTKGRGANLLVDYEIDFQAAGSLSLSVQGFGDPLGSGAGSFQLGSSQLGGGESFQHHEALLTGSGHFISFEFTNTGANQPFTLLGVGVEAMAEGTDKWAP